MTQLTNEAFKSLLQKVLDTRSPIVIDVEVESLCLYSTRACDRPPGTVIPTPRQQEILYNIYAAHAIDVKWLIAAYHLQNDEQYTAINQWLIQKHRTDTIPDLGERYNFEA